MTIGELARMFNSERKIGADLHVIEVEGWDRLKRFDKTGLAWVDPSPNIRSLDAALLYPGIALLEATNVSVGRGTDAPFRRVGAPWVDRDALAQVLANEPGVSIEATTFTPTSSRHAGKLCRGIALRIIDPDRLDAVHLGLRIAHQLLKQHRAAWKAQGLLTLLGNRTAFNQLVGGAAVDDIIASWRQPLAEFDQRRQRFLLY